MDPFLLIAFFHLASGLIQTQTTLNAQITSQNGASISHNPATSSTSGSNYNIQHVSAEDDIGYDIKLSLNKSWSFQPNIASYIILEIDGSTPHPDTDTDFMLVFSVNDWQYFSFFVHLDYTFNMKSRIYPAISMQNITTSVSEWISGDERTLRYNRISNDDKWLTTSNGWNKQALWPLTFVVINDPINNEIVVELYHNTTQTYATGYILEDDIFIPNKSIDIYVMTDSVGEQMTISSFDIELGYNETSTESTIIPTTMLFQEPQIDYGISIIIGFRYVFSIIQLDEITRITQQHFIINSNDDDCKEWTKQIITTKANMTIINATIYLCDKLTQNQLLVVANNGNLQGDIIRNINEEIENIEIMENKTWIEANIINKLSPNPTQTTDLMNVTLYEQIMNNYDKSFMANFFLIIFIAIPIIAFCSFLSFLKMNTNKKEKKETQHINLSLRPSATHHISEIEESYDHDSAHIVRKNSKSYKMRKYRKPITDSIDIMSPATSKKSYNPSNKLSTSPISQLSTISPRDYKTRGISDDVYDPDFGATQRGISDDIYNKCVFPSETPNKLSMISQVNTNTYHPSVPTSPPETVQQSPIYKLPQSDVTKRQWL